MLVYKELIESSGETDHINMVLRADNICQIWKQPRVPGNWTVVILARHKKVTIHSSHMILCTSE